MYRDEENNCIGFVFNGFYSRFSQEEARVMKVKDGDTYVLKTTAKEHTIRLLNVDAPELNQHWGFNSWLNVKSLDTW